jgi:hypothetical protein
MSVDTVPSSPWSVDDLLDGDPLTDPGGGELRMVWSQLHHHLYVNTPNVVEAFCTVVRRRPQTPAKLVALHAADQATGRLAELVDELLANELLLYAHYRGSKLVAAAITSWWPHLDQRQRRAVVDHVEAANVVSPSFADLRGLISRRSQPRTGLQTSNVVSANSEDHEIAKLKDRPRGPRSPRSSRRSPCPSRWRQCRNGLIKPVFRGTGS